MKSLLCAVAAIALMAPQAASAQPRDQHQRNTAQHNERNAQRRHAAPRQQRAAPQRRQRQRAVTQRTRTTTKVTRPNGQVRTTRVTRTSKQQYYRPGHRPATYHRMRVTTAFRYPRGYHYRRYRIGLVLPRIFLSNYYYWTDWSGLGLLPPPPGYVWVRFGPDLLLVNRYTGRIVDVIYGAFY